MAGCVYVCMHSLCTGGGGIVRYDMVWLVGWMIGWLLLLPRSMVGYFWLDR